MTPVRSNGDTISSALARGPPQIASWSPPYPLGFRAQRFHVAPEPPVHGCRTGGRIVLASADGNRRSVLAQKIYVGNLPFSTSEGELEELFAQYGEVLSVALP